MKKVLPVIIMLLFACSDEQKKQQAGSTPALPEATHVPVNFDHRKGEELIIANCQTCHTARYIEMQPKLTRKVWEKTVDKMIRIYGAPIDSLTAIAIVDHLMIRQED